MNDDIKALIDSVKSLKQESNIFKDYIYPISIVFISSFFGWFVGIISFYWQEVVKNFKEQHDIINTWTLRAEYARSLLISIKENYCHKLSSDPIERVKIVAFMLLDRANILDVDDLSKLIFLVPTKKQKINSKWGNIISIRNLIENYNSTLRLWIERNAHFMFVKNVLRTAFPHRTLSSITFQEFKSKIETSDIVMLIDLTERCIRFTDELIFELSDFLLGFPQYAICITGNGWYRRILNKLILPWCRKILTFKDAELKYLSIPCKEPDYNMISSITRIDIEELKKIYSIGYIN